MNILISFGPTIPSALKLDINRRKSESALVLCINFANGNSLHYFPAGVLEQNVHRANRGSHRRRLCGRRRTSCITFTASPASCAADSWPQGTSFTSWRTGGWCAKWIMRQQNKMVGFSKDLKCRKQIMKRFCCRCFYRWETNRKHSTKW